MFKRISDILLSFFGIILTLPFLPFVALLIKIDSQGPVFYLATRVGKDMKNFKMYKFRTMIETPIEVGESLSPQYDPRVTTFGRFLRRTKLNEFPQLLNILKGDMTFVGPRPESPDLAELYPENAKRIFSVTPGLVGPNQILGRNEEELYPPGVDVKKYYIDNILPNKVKVDLEYIKKPTILTDIVYVFAGVKATILNAFNKTHIHNNRSQLYLIVADVLLSFVSFSIAYILSGNLFPTGRNLTGLTLFVIALLITRLAFNILFGMYNSLIRYISYFDIWETFKSVTCGSLLFFVLCMALDLNYYSINIFIVDWLFLSLFLITLRFSLRFYWETKKKPNTDRKKKKILIFGADRVGSAAYYAVLSDIDNPVNLVGFIDDDPKKYGKRMNGLKVLGNRTNIKALVKLYRVHEIILASRYAGPDVISEIIKICRKSGVKYRVFSFAGNNGNNNMNHFPVRNVELCDILHLKQINMDHGAVKNIINGKTVLINGSGGELGMELCSNILRLGCKKLIIVDRYESYLTELTVGLYNLFSHEKIVPIHSIDTDLEDPFKDVFIKYRPNIVFHASMKKYTSVFKPNNDDIIKTNYLRTYYLAKQTIDLGCEFFILISSFAASNNGNNIAKTLRLAELSLQAFYKNTNCRLVITRICDVVENRGGIVSLLENQIRNQQTVLLPYSQAQTSLISKYSAAEFILQTLVEVTNKASEQGIFICEPGSPVLFTEIAEKLALLYGLQIGVDLAVKYLNGFDKNLLLQVNNESAPAPTSNSNISFLKEKGGPDSLKTELTQKDWEIQMLQLLNLQE